MGTIICASDLNAPGGKAGIRMTLSLNHGTAGPWALLPATSRGPPARGEAALPPPGGWDPRPLPGLGSPTTYVQSWGGGAGRRKASPRRRAAADEAVGEAGDPIKPAGPQEAPPGPGSGHTPQGPGPAGSLRAPVAALGVRAPPAEGVSARRRAGPGAREAGGGTAGRPRAARNGRARRGEARGPWRPPAPSAREPLRPRPRPGPSARPAREAARAPAGRSLLLAAPPARAPRLPGSLRSM